MPEDTSAPPEAEACLTTSRASSYKGGTLIVASVRDRATHEGLIRDPDGYRPTECARCLHDVLHVCAYPERRPRGEADDPPLHIVQYECANEDCGATWRMLARHLWRRWATVERVVEDVPPTRTSLPIPQRTERRWRARYASAATAIVVLFATSNAAALEAIAMRLTRTSTRSALVAAYVDFVAVRPGRRLANVAERVDRLKRGIRLM